MEHLKLQDCGLALGLMTSTLGIAAFFRPYFFLDGFNLAVPDATTPAAHVNTLKSTMYIFGARDLTFGLIMLGLWADNNTRGVGVVMAVGTGLALMDGIITRKSGHYDGKGLKGSGFEHWAFMPALAYIGGKLLKIF